MGSSEVLCRVSAFLCLWFTLVVAHEPCRSSFCIRISSRKIDVNVNLFNSTAPLPIEDLIKQFGYPVEVHKVQTEDGYILKYHRIPRGKAATDGPSQGEPVFLQHGLLGASSSWVLEPYGLAYVLADAGFDVWLGNARGNMYSRDHVKYDPDSDKKKFWDFSWHEMGYYDLPAGIDYILNSTRAAQLHYLGHSMGTTMFLVLGSTRPGYMSKVKSAVFMAPIAFPWNIRSPLANFFMRLHTALNWLSSAFGIYEVFPYSYTNTWLDNNICANQRTAFVCKDVMLYLGGFEEAELNRTDVVRVLQYMPAGTSFKTLKHIRQISKKGGDFKPFDYGYIGNLWKYHSFNPPPYNLTKVSAPIYMYYAMNDWLAVPEDVHHAASHLPNVARLAKVSDDTFNHLDFMWAKDAKTLLYDDIVSTLQGKTYETPLIDENYDIDNTV